MMMSLMSLIEFSVYSFNDWEPCTESPHHPDPVLEPETKSSGLLVLTVNMRCVWTAIKFVSAQALTLPAVPSSLTTAVWLASAALSPCCFSFLNLLVSFSTSLHSLASQSNLLFGREEGLCWYCTFYTSVTQIQHAAFPKYLLHRGTSAQPLTVNLLHHEEKTDSHELFKMYQTTFLMRKVAV